MAKTKAKKRNPQDTTLRNTRAANKRIDALEKRVKALEDLVYGNELYGRAPATELDGANKVASGG